MFSEPKKQTSSFICQFDIFHTSITSLKIFNSNFLSVLNILDISFYVICPGRITLFLLLTKLLREEWGLRGAFRTISYIPVHLFCTFWSVIQPCIGCTSRIYDGSTHPAFISVLSLLQWTLPFWTLKLFTYFDES